MHVFMFTHTFMHAYIHSLTNTYTLIALQVEAEQALDDVDLALEKESGLVQRNRNTLL